MGSTGLDSRSGHKWGLEVTRVYMADQVCKGPWQDTRTCRAFLALGGRVAGLTLLDA